MNHKEATRGHVFAGTERVPGYCVRCGCAEFVHAHPARHCRAETCGGVWYDPCEWAVLDGDDRS